MPNYSKNAQIELTRESAELERRLVPITAEMNEKPLRVNRETWLRNLLLAEDEMMFLVAECQKMSGDPDFRPGSTEDCGRVLFTEQGNEPGKISAKSRRPSVNQDILANLANQGNKLAAKISEARTAIHHVSQLKAWKPYADTGKVHPVWDSMGQPHGRYTSKDPCLNNRVVPIRETVEPDQGFSFLSVDLGQAEYVSWASLSNDNVWGAAFEKGTDFHSETAEMVKALVPEWDLNGDTPRQAGKTLNFAITYRMQAWTLAFKLGCSQDTAKAIIAALESRAARAQAFVKEVLAAAKKKGYVETFYGRRRLCPEYKTNLNEHDRKDLEKTIWHHVNGGTAAEFLKWKQVKAWEMLRKLGYGTDEVRLSIQMYDEVIFQVRDDLRQEVSAVVEKIFCQRETGFLPFPVTVKIGKSWKEISK